jgi:Importin beta binding domain
LIVYIIGNTSTKNSRTFTVVTSEDMVLTVQTLSNLLCVALFLHYLITMPALAQKKSFKAIKDDTRVKREDAALSLRKEKRAEGIQKKRNLCSTKQETVEIASKSLSSTVSIENLHNYCNGK